MAQYCDVIVVDGVEMGDVAAAAAMVRRPMPMTMRRLVGLPFVVLVG